MSTVNQIVSRVHEGCSPYFTSKERSQLLLDDEYGGITGTILPGSFAKLMKAAEHLPELSFNEESIFCDVGCGTGRPNFYLSNIKMKDSIGFDIDPLQVLNAKAGYSKLKQSKKIDMVTPIQFFELDVYRLKTLDPVTHVYAFLGYSAVAARLAALLVHSKTLKVMFIVTLRKEDLRECGLISDEDEDVIFVPGLKMGAGNSYLGVVIPTDNLERRNRIETMMLPSTAETDIYTAAAAAASTTATSRKRIRRSISYI